MQALEFCKEITVDKSNFLERFVAVLNENRIRYCVIGGQAVNAYVEPLVSLDLDVVIALDQIEQARSLLAEPFKIEEFPHSINISLVGSELRVQLQNDPRYIDFVNRTTRCDVLGLTLPVAALDDILRGKIWEAQDPQRRPSKRQKDLADIARVIESFPNLRDRVPDEILKKIE
jgi:hypothetical protein